MTIPQEVCQTPPAEQDPSLGADIRLGLSCEDGVVAMSWNTSLESFFYVHNISLYTKCITAQWSGEVSVDVDLPSGSSVCFINFCSLLYAKLKVFSATNVPYVNQTQVNVPGQAACTFYGWYFNSNTESTEAIPPAQCYMDQPRESMY